MDQLMTALEIEEEKIVSSRKKFDLNSLIKKSAEKFKNAAENKKINFKIDAAGILFMNCDEEKIGKVLDIMIKNAILYNPSEGEISVNSFEKTFEGKRMAVVAIKDGGIGIDEFDEGNIFKKFFRSAAAKSVSPNGLGLGLFISKRFIELHGGDIWFESAGKDKGAAFYFSLSL